MEKRGLNPLLFFALLASSFYTKNLEKIRDNLCKMTKPKEQKILLNLLTRARFCGIILYVEERGQRSPPQRKEQTMLEIITIIAAVLGSVICFTMIAVIIYESAPFDRKPEGIKNYLNLVEKIIF